jgi:8-oxo-dGTP diphosphatase
MDNNSREIITAVDLDGNEHQIPVAELSWRPSVYGIVIDDGKLLLLHQKQGYDLPGGGVDLGETLENGVIREVKEESGLEVANPRLIGGTSNFFKFAHTDGHSVQSLLLYYSCELVGGELSTEGFDEYEKEYAHGCEWYPLEKLDELKLASSNDFRPYVRQLI